MRSDTLYDFLHFILLHFIAFRLVSRLMILFFLPHHFVRGWPWSFRISVIITIFRAVLFLPSVLHYSVLCFYMRFPPYSYFLAVYIAPGAMESTENGICISSVRY